MIAVTPGRPHCGEKRASNPLSANAICLEVGSRHDQDRIGPLCASCSRDRIGMRNLSRVYRKRRWNPKCPRLSGLRCRQTCSAGRTIGSETPARPEARAIFPCNVGRQQSLRAGGGRAAGHIPVFRSWRSEAQCALARFASASVRAYYPGPRCVLLCTVAPISHRQLPLLSRRQ